MKKPQISARTNKMIKGDGGAVWLNRYENEQNLYVYIK